MREIKFRYWCKIENKMYDKAYVEKHLDLAFMSELIESAQERYDFQQFTGLKDKNGKEIYEGDIVDTLDGLGRVIYDNDLCTFSIEYDISIIAFIHYVTQEKASLEVIGNIYEHSHLLEGK